MASPCIGAWEGAGLQDGTDGYRDLKEVGIFQRTVSWRYMNIS